jgi:hypothetical protein
MKAAHRNLGQADHLLTKIADEVIRIVYSGHANKDALITFCEQYLLLDAVCYAAVVPTSRGGRRFAVVLPERNNSVARSALTGSLK